MIKKKLASKLLNIHQMKFALIQHLKSNTQKHRSNQFKTKPNHITKKIN
jgi:hypothetical protein